MGKYTKHTQRTARSKKKTQKKQREHEKIVGTRREQRENLPEEPGFKNRP